MTKLILFTGTKCPKCPGARTLVREVAQELDLKEGKDFVEKLIDGGEVEVGSEAEIDGSKLWIVSSEDEIKKTPAAIGGRDLTIEALTYQIASTPAIIIDDELAFIGEMPTREELIKRLQS